MESERQREVKGGRGKRKGGDESGDAWNIKM
jgi:hypothetical protein